LYERLGKDRKMVECVTERWEDVMKTGRTKTSGLKIMILKDRLFSSNEFKLTDRTGR